MALAPVLAMSATVPSGSPALRSAVPSPPVVRATARSDDSGRSSRPCVDWSPVNRSRSADECMANLSLRPACHDHVVVLLSTH